MLETIKEPIPRAEYPRPQFVRDQWLCLNGWWEFETDPGDSGWERGLHQRELAERILVPFCPEAPLSGIGTIDRVASVWYRRVVEIPLEWSGQIVLLHFQAVDHEATVWVNGKEVGRHKGGFTPFHCDLTPVVQPGEMATIVVRARDPWWEPQPRGKQSREVQPHGVLYRRTTGIWQTVWLSAPAALGYRAAPNAGRRRRSYPPRAVPFSPPGGPRPGRWALRRPRRDSQVLTLGHRGAGHHVGPRHTDRASPAVVPGGSAPLFHRDRVA